MTIKETADLFEQLNPEDKKEIIKVLRMMLAKREAATKH